MQPSFNINAFPRKAEVLSTQKLGEFEEFHYKETEPRKFSPLQPGKISRIEISHLQLNLANIYGCKFSSPIRGVSEPLKCFQIILPEAGTLVTRDRDQDIAVIPGQAFVAFPGNCVDNRYLRDTQTLVIRIDSKRLEPLISVRVRQMSGLNNCLISTAYGAGYNFHGLIGQILTECNGKFKPEGVDPLANQQSLEDLLLYSLSLAIDNQFALHLPAGSEESKLPGNLEVVLDYIYNNLDTHIAVTELAEMAGVSCRVLQKRFMKHLNRGPMSYIKEARLNKVREELLRSSPEEASVTDIAMRWGFFHLGDFSRYYSNQFGELPSKTLRQ